MKGIYINSVVVWNAFWSHGHQLAMALAKDQQVLFFESVRLTENAQSGLYEKSSYKVPVRISILRQARKFTRVNLAYLLYSQYVSLKSLFTNRKQFGFFLSYNFLDVAGTLFARMLGKKTIFLFIDEYDTLTRWPHMTPVFRLFLIANLKWSHAVVCTAKKLCERAEKYNRNVHYLPNAVDGSLVPGKSQHSDSKDRPVIGYVGSLGSWVEVEVFVKLAKDFPSCTIEVLGDGARFQELVTAKEHGKLENLVLRGHVSHDDIGVHLSRFDMALIPFFRNTITDSVSPIKLFEYWRFGIPVIARLTHELEGFVDSLLLYETYEQCNAHVQHLLDHPDEARRLGEVGKKLVETTYNWEHYRQVFRDTILR